MDQSLVPTNMGNIPNQKLAVSDHLRGDYDETDRADEKISCQL